MKLRNKIALAVSAFALLALPQTASGHVTVSPAEIPASGYAMLTFVVPHGCDGAATNQVRLQMPPQVISATPGVVAGWDIRTREGELPQPAEQHGETVTEGVREVTWSGGPLADDQLQQFPLNVAIAGEPGETLEFKVIQGCVGGAESAWIQSASDGEEPDYPAPTVVLGEAGDGHGHGAEDHDGEEAADAEQASAADSESNGNGLSVAALIVGGLGLLTGGGALISSRRK